jgi:polygalacturonase
LRFIQSQDITIKGVTLRNSGCWMQHYLACDRLKIDGIKVFNRNNYNNDALDLDGCHDVIVTDMLADSDDDAITLKSTSPRLCENVRISNCVVSSHCNAIKLGTESNGGYRNISISGIVVKPSADQSSKFFGNDRGTSVISLEVVDGGVLENVQVSNIVAEGTEVPIFIRLGNRARGYYEGQQISHVGTLRNVTISDVTVRDAGSIGSSITGLPGHNVEDITLRNISIEHRGGGQKTAVPADEKEKEYPEGTMWGMLPAQGFFVRHARGVVFENIKIRALSEDKRPEYVREDAD